MAEGPTPVYKKLWFEILSAKIYGKLDVFGLSYSYVQINLIDKISNEVVYSYKTSAKSRTKTPVWNTKFRLYVKPEEHKVSLAMFTRLTHDDLIGLSEVSLEEAFSEGEKTYQLMNRY
jgi:Ca2+-dependent lipid-binding protein